MAQLLHPADPGNTGNTGRGATVAAGVAKTTRMFLPGTVDGR